MQIFKRLTAAILAAALALGTLTACGGGGGSSGGGEQSFISMVNSNLEGSYIQVKENPDVSALIKEYNNLFIEYCKLLGINSYSEYLDKSGRKSSSIYSDYFGYSAIYDLEQQADQTRLKEIQDKAGAVEDKLEKYYGISYEAAGSSAEQAKQLADELKEVYYSSHPVFTVTVYIGYCQFTFGESYVWVLYGTR